MQKKRSILITVGLTILLIAMLVPFFRSESHLQWAFRNLSLPAVMLLNFIGLYICGTFLYRQRHRLATLYRQHRLPLLFIIILFCGALYKSDNQYRVLSDETNLISVSQALYMSQQPVIQTEALNANNRFTPITLRDPKRPIQFATVLFYLHGLFGYSYQYGFYVNNVLLLVFLLFVYGLSQQLAGKAIGLAICMLTLAHPAIILTATSSGFDFFSLCALLLLFLLVLKGKNKDLNSTIWSWLVTWGMLAYARYECILFASLLLAWGLWQHREKILPFLQQRYNGVLAILILIVPRFHQLILTSSKHAERGAQTTFSSAFMHGNLMEYLRAYMTPGESPYSHLVALLLLVIMIMFVFLNATELPARIKTNWPKVLSSIFFVAVIHALYLCHYFGKAMHPAGYRLFLLPATSLILLVLPLTKQLPHRAKIAIFFGSLAAMLSSSQTIERDPFLAISPLERTTNQAYEWLSTNSQPQDSLLVAQRPGQYTVNNYAAINFDTFQKRHKELMEQLQTSRYHQVLFLQQVDKKNGKGIKGCELPLGVQIEPLFEVHYNYNSNLRISRWSINQQVPEK